MPRRSPDHLEMRRRQILSAAIRCFAREGFHRTSMADVISEAGVSAGSVYRYFPSKEELIRAATGDIFAVASSALREALDAEEALPPWQALSTVMTATLDAGAASGVDPSRVAVNAWAEALRDPALLAIVQDFYGAVVDDLVAVVERWRDAGHLPADADVEAAGRHLFGSIPGYIVQRLLLEDGGAAGVGRGLEALMSPAPGAHPQGSTARG